MEDLSHYLIPGSCILSDKKEIFTDLSGKEFRFTVFPGDEAGFEEGMQKISEILLSKLPHNNQNAAIIGYGFYQICISGRIGPSELRSILEIPGDREKEEKEEVEQCLDYYAEHQRHEDRLKKKERQKEKQRRTFPFWTQVLGKLKRKPKKTYPKPSEAEDEEIFHLLYEDKTDFTPEEETDPYGTVFVRQEDLYADGTPKMTGVLTPVNPSEGAALYLKNDNCMAGRAAKDVDVIIKNETVSRVHARFSRRNGSYAVQDCRSTNGTSVNGRKLPPDSCVTLSDGDEIRLGTAAYRFHRDFSGS